MFPPKMIHTRATTEKPFVQNWRRKKIQAKNKSALNYDQLWIVLAKNFRFCLFISHMIFCWKFWHVSHSFLKEDNRGSHGGLCKKAKFDVWRLRFGLVNFAVKCQTFLNIAQKSTEAAASWRVKSSGTAVIYLEQEHPQCQGCQNVKNY